jgi:hypothetical protein
MRERDARAVGGDIHPVRCADAMITAAILTAIDVRYKE